MRDIDAAEAEERKIQPADARKKRVKMMERNKKLLAADSQIVLSDE